MAGKRSASDVAVAIVVIIGVPFVLFAGFMILQVGWLVWHLEEEPGAAPISSAATFPTAGRRLPVVDTVGFGHGAFYVAVDRGPATDLQWIESTDGGRTWTAADDPGGLAAADASDSYWFGCASDGVCYRATRGDAATPGTGRTDAAVERRSPGVGWVTEQVPVRVAGFAALAVDAGHSDRVVAWPDGGATLLYRTSGQWRAVDILEVADHLR